MMRKRPGFTLIEMLVVIFIIGILATVVFVGFTNAKGKSNYSKTYTDLSSISKAAGLYNAQYSKYPDETSSGEVTDPAFTKFLPTWPKNICTDHAYYYHNDILGVGVYLKYKVRPVNLFYQNISNLRVCQYGVTNPVSSYCQDVAAYSPPEALLKPLVDRAYAAPVLYDLPYYIADVPGRSFSCNDYKTYLP